MRCCSVTVVKPVDLKSSYWRDPNKSRLDSQSLISGSHQHAVRQQALLQSEAAPTTAAAGACAAGDTRQGKPDTTSQRQRAPLAIHAQVAAPAVQTTSQRQRGEMLHQQHRQHAPGDTAAGLLLAPGLLAGVATLMTAAQCYVATTAAEVALQRALTMQQRADDLRRRDSSSFSSASAAASPRPCAAGAAGGQNGRSYLASEGPLLESLSLLARRSVSTEEEEGDDEETGQDEFITPPSSPPGSDEEDDGFRTPHAARTARKKKAGVTWGSSPAAAPAPAEAAAAPAAPSEEARASPASRWMWHPSQRKALIAAQPRTQPDFATKEHSDPFLDGHIAAQCASGQLPNVTPSTQAILTTTRLNRDISERLLAAIVPFLYLAQHEPECRGILSQAERGQRQLRADGTNPGVLAHPSAQVIRVG